VAIREENQTLATITLQNSFRLYGKLSGMTGTALTEATEFMKIYNVSTIDIPTHRPMIRDDHNDQIYKTRDGKWKAVLGEIKERHERGQPILVGTVSVEVSEMLSAELKRSGVDHVVLNAKPEHAQREGETIAQAGRIGAVTIATNMAGRGVDIKLGGNPEGLAKAELRKLGVSPENESYDEELNALTPQIEQRCAEEGEQVLERGGLFICGTERHESRRIDNQLRGRSGRQGDPGASRFYLSLEDDLMRLFNASAVESIMTRLKVPEDIPIEHKMVSRAVARAQAQVEARNFEVRKNVLKYDDVMNKQREVIYAQRSTVLEGADDEKVAEYAEDFLEDTVRNLCATYAPDGVYPEEWSLEELWTALERIYPVGVDRAGLDLEKLDAKGLVDLLLDDIMTRYEQREAELSPKVMREVERRVILSVVDRVWREHLYEMDHLRDGIGLRAVGQRDPLVEYQREAYDAFVEMMARIKEEAAGYFFNLPVQRAEPRQQRPQPDARRPQAGVRRPALRDEARTAPSQRLSYTSSNPSSGSPPTGSAASYTPNAAPSGAPPPAAREPERPAASGAPPPRPAASGAPPPRPAAAGAPDAHVPVVKGHKVGRNELCPCGSGLKYKRCHGSA
jgi:preprotein translocase subunit SecA